MLKLPAVPRVGAISGLSDFREAALVEVGLFVLPPIDFLCREKLFERFASAN